jgi:asparagine synthase (glutamine-hydrolysing)
MSGVLAIATWDGTPVSPRSADQMAQAAPHLGDVERWHGEGIIVASLGSPAALRQDDELIVAVDGRIDNGDEIAHQLKLPASVSAASLVLAAYRRWGSGMPAALLGDFVVVVWDDLRRYLFVGRDPMGCRNVYYQATPHRLLLASELKQILAAPDVSPEPDEESLLADLAGLYALPSSTAYHGIAQLAPGHTLEHQDGISRTERYWQLDPGHRIRHRRESDYAEQFLDIFGRAVEVRMRPSPLTAILLSGGLDSTSVVSTAAWLQRTSRLQRLDLHAFSWAFADLVDGDERDVARAVASDARIPLTDVPADDAWPLSGGPEHGPDRDDPFSWLYQRLFDRSLAAARTAGAASVITADRGDELMGNWIYDDLGLLLAWRFSEVRQDLRAYRERYGVGTLSYLSKSLLRPALTGLWPPGRLTWLRSRMPGAPKSPVPPPWIPPRHVRRTAELMEAASPAPAVRGHARLQRAASISDVSSLRIAEMRQRSARRRGLDHADPWADVRLAQFALDVPQWRLQRYSRGKYLARDAMNGIMPEAARRNARQVFPVGLYKRAFNEREVGTVRSLMQDSRAAALGWLDAGEVLKAYDTYLGGGNLAHDFWYPITVELWLRAWWD